MLNNLGLNGKNPPIYHIYVKDRPSLTDEDIAIVGKAIVDESKVSDEHVAFEAGMKQVRSMYFNGKLVYNYRPCEKIELNARELVLTNTVDNSFKLSVKVTPSNCTEEVTFTSSNTDVATVNRDGSIHPVNLGTCDIIATCDKKSVACKVHVKEQTLYLYNRGVVNNNSEFGQIVHPSDTSKFRYATDNIFLTLAGSTSNYGTIWFSWANRVDFGEYDVLYMDITNTADHSTIIGLTRNNKTGQQGYQNGNPTAVDGTTFVEDRTIIALKQGVNKHSLDVDLVNGEGYLGLYFKRNTGTGDTLEEFINVNTIYLIRKSVYVLGTGVDTSEEVNVPCTGLSFIQDEIDLEYTGNTMYNLKTLLSIEPKNCDEHVQWTVIDDGDHVMNVNDTGYLSITGLGSAHVQAICGNHFDSIRVNTISSCAGVSLNKTSATLDLLGTKTVTLTATVTPSNTTDTVTWKSSNTNVATVSNGVVTAKGNGTCTITATCGSKSATCSVTVKTSCTGISLEQSSYTLDLSGTSATLVRATVTPSDTTDIITWKSSDTSVVNVTTTGLITAQGVGTTTLTATCGNKTATCSVTVKASCTGISLSKTSLSFTSIGATDTIVVTPTPSNTTDVVSWKSSNNDVATITQFGLVTSRGAGTCTLTATCGNKTATCSVTVKASCTGISLSKTSLSFTSLNATQTLSATLTPSNTTDIVSWKSSNTNVATVNSSGVVTSKAAGSCTITATCGSKSATCSVNVTVACTGVSLSKSTYTLDLSGTNSVTFTPTISPSNTTDSITWKSSNTSVATVSATSGGVKGTIFAKSTGTANITVNCGSKSASVTVTVKASCTGVSLNNYSLSFTSLNATQTLSATVTPSNTTDSVTWKSSNTSIATVNSNGVVTSKAVGSCTITATCGSKSATCSVTVNNPNPYLVLSAANSYMAVGEQHTFYADLYNGNLDNLIINLSKPDSFTLTYSRLSSTRVAVTVKMLKDESGAVNFNYNSQLLDRFEIYIRV